MSKAPKADMQPLRDPVATRAMALSVLQSVVPLSGPGSGDPVTAVCHWFAAYDVKQFADLETFTSNVRSVQERIRAAAPRAGFERVYAPGDLENERARDWSRDGMPVENTFFDDLRWVAQTCQIRFDLLD